MAVTRGRDGNTGDQGWIPDDGIEQIPWIAYTNEDQPPGDTHTAAIQPTPRGSQLGYAFVATNLLLTTLAVASVAVLTRAPLSFSPQQKYQVRCDQQHNLLVTTLAPVTATATATRAPLVFAAQRKYQVQCEQQPNVPGRLLPGFMPVGDPHAMLLPAPPRKLAVTVEPPPNLIKHPLPDFLPVGKRATEGVGQGKAQVQAEQYPSLLTTTLATTATVTQTRAPLVFAAQSKYQLRLDTWPNLLTTTLGFKPLPIGDQISDSAPPPKFRLTGPILVGQIPQPSGAAPAPLPIGDQISDSAPPPKYRSQVDVYPDNLTTGIPPPAQVPAWADFDPVPAPSRFLPPFDPPNLILSTLRTAQPLPVGKQLSVSSPPPKVPVEVDVLRTNLVLGIAVVPPPAIPLGLPVDTSRADGKAPVQVDVYPNTLILGIPQPPPPPITGAGSNPGGGAGGQTWSGKFEFSRKPLPRPPLTEAEYNRLPEARQFVKDQHSVQMSLEAIVAHLEAEKQAADDDDDEALLLLL